MRMLSGVFCTKCGKSQLNCKCKSELQQLRNKVKEMDGMMEEMVKVLFQGSESCYDSWQELEALAEGAGWSDKESVISHARLGYYDCQSMIAKYHKYKEVK